MGLISGLLTLPLAPVKGVVWVGEQVRQEAERQWADPGVLQAEMADVEAMRERGEISEAEAEAREEELLQRLLGASPHQGMTLEPWDGDDDA